MSLCLLIHGDPGVGKTTLAATAPAPRLIIDCEGGSRFLRQYKVEWDPTTGAPPPVPDGTWETCVVVLRDYRQVDLVWKWLNSGQHYFRSVIIDSLTEAQKRCLDNISGVEQPQQQHWGALLRQLEDLVRKLRDLAFHPVNPLDAIVITCLTHMRDGKFRAFVKGQLELTLPSFPDVVGYMYVDIGPEGAPLHKMQIAPYGPFDAKDRTSALTARYGLVVSNPRIDEMLQVLAEDPFLGIGAAPTPAQ